MTFRRTTPPTERKRARLRLGPRLGLPMLALGLAAMLPARVAGLADLLPELAPAETRPRPVAMRDGTAFAVPVSAATLAGTPRANPLGEDRAVDARMLAELARRQAELERRERELELREARAAAAETLARTQLGELGRMRQEVEKLVVRETAVAEADLEALVALYVNMKPPQAAKVLERLEATRAAAVLLKIPDRQAGPILASMEPPAALAVTQEIAGRREAFRR
ncbi:MotE family protein [Paracraurococcus ruber]|uniref:Magnesium transporter MgtE intracellular domain-containing protein n=1 Tax=Paracraurococcus ruber TaxID=77675 RepID=A0ABS1CZS2_9PROT|nr:hypothetical protein [Paracraurococcus ruber]MBK1660030.1 hypothetical protein [Paracraurococcus ruber]TDG28625.1 hypothetical protein E2C05_20225 [Paracraurococcus ruber]